LNIEEASKALPGGKGRNSFIFDIGKIFYKIDNQFKFPLRGDRGL